MFSKRRQNDSFNNGMLNTGDGIAAFFFFFPGILIGYLLCPSKIIFLPFFTVRGEKESADFDNKWKAGGASTPEYKKMNLA